MQFKVSIAGKEHDLDLVLAENRWKCRLDGHSINIDVSQIASESLSILRDGKSYEVRRIAENVLAVGEQVYEFSIADPRSWRSRRESSTEMSGPQKLTASMPGKVVRLLTSAGTKVSTGQGIVVIEAMKMQNEIRAPREGTVRSILVREGQAVSAGEVVAIVE
jgi:biotin carboxyl carrier protein